MSKRLEILLTVVPLTVSNIRLVSHESRGIVRAIGYAHEIKIYALAKLGDLLKHMPKAKGAEGIGKSKSAVPERYRTQPVAYADLGLDKEDGGGGAAARAARPERRKPKGRGRNLTVRRTMAHTPRN